MKLVKGSAAAKAYMAKIRAKKGKPKKTAVKKTAAKKVGAAKKSVLKANKSYAVIKYNTPYKGIYTVHVVEFNKYSLRRNSDYKNTTLHDIYDNLKEAYKVADNIYNTLNKNTKKVGEFNKISNSKFKKGDLVKVKGKSWVMVVDKVTYVAPYGNQYFLENDRRGTMTGNAGAYFENEIELSKRNKVGSTLNLHKKETRLGMPPKTTSKSGNGYHKDTKSHNVNIRVVSGVKESEINFGVYVKGKRALITKSPTMAISEAKFYSIAFNSIAIIKSGNSIFAKYKNGKKI